MPGFATYLYPHTCYTSKPVEQIRFVGHSYPHFSQVRAELAEALAGYPTLAVRKADYTDYLSVHTESYLDKLRLMASGEPVKELPKLSIECTGLLEHVPWPPDLILIFSGYDSHKGDCGKNITDWSEQEYRHLTRSVLELAKRASCPVLSVHGGGYKLPTTISAAVCHVDVLAHYH